MSSVQETYLKAIADAIREKEGSSDPIPANKFAERIRQLVINSGIAPPDGKNYLTFTHSSDFYIYIPSKQWEGPVEYYTGNGVWAACNKGKVSSVRGVKNNYVLYMRGTGNSKITGNSSNYAWQLSKPGISCTGNIENLLDYSTVKAGGHPVMANFCFAYMFYAHNTRVSLSTAPSLPATTLSHGCYSSMFETCNLLTTLPSLPATVLPENCYNSMFCDCSKIKLSKTMTGEYVQAYRIPVSGNGSLAPGQYALAGMFRGTGGAFAGTPTVNTTYYLSSGNSIV